MAGPMADVSLASLQTMMHYEVWAEPMSNEHDSRKEATVKSSMNWRTVAVCAAAALALSACGGQGTGTATGGTGAGTTGGVTELTFWHGMTGPDGPAVTEVVDAFNASQSDIVVKAEVMPWDVLYQRLLTSVSTPNGPDVIAMSASNMPQYAAMGALAPTDDFYSGDDYMDTSVLADAAVDASKFRGVNYGVPFNISTMMLYWNKDLFAAAGLDPEAPPTTWDEFEEMASKLTVDENGDGKPEQYAIALADHVTIAMYQPLLWNNGGGVVSEDGTTAIVDSPESIEALERWVGLVKDKKVSPIGLAGADADKLFQTGKAAMEIVGPWMTSGFDEAGLNYGLARPFAGPEAQLTLADVVTLTLNAQADAGTKDAAYTFFAYWNSVESQTTWANGSGFPSQRSDIPAENLTNKNSTTFGAPELMQNSRVYLAGVPNAATITDTIFYPALQKALNGEGTVKDLFGEAADAIQAQIDK